MKIVINKCFGGFSVSDEACDILGLEGNYDADRCDARLVALVEEDAIKASGCLASLRVVEMPDDTTDYTIMEHDGWETLLYVVDGKIYKA